MIPASVRVVVTLPAARAREADLACLTEDERRRADGLRVPAARARHVAGRACARRLLASQLGRPPSTVPLGTTGHGALRVRGHPSLSVSVTHTDGLVVVAVADGLRVGVDAERTDRRRLPPSGRWVAPEELAQLPTEARDRRGRALLELWTAKEAVAKALGTGLATPLTAIAVVEGRITVHGTADPDGVVEAVDVPATHVATLATLTGGPGRAA